MLLIRGKSKVKYHNFNPVYLKHQTYAHPEMLYLACSLFNSFNLNNKQSLPIFDVTL